MSAQAVYVRFTAPVRNLAKFVPIFALLLAAAVHAGVEAASVPVVALATDRTAETVFRWRTDRCDDNQYPDAPARAFRGANGTVHLFAPHSDNRALIGTTLDAVRIDCRSVYEGRGDDDPSAYDDKVWLSSFYTQDGRNVAALAHAEFHGHLRPALCPWHDYHSCWWNGVVGLVSRDGGETFARPPGAASIVAALRGPYNPVDRRPVGYFSPSNIIAWQGRFYSFVFAEARGEQKRGPCLLRTQAPFDPSAWRGWDGNDFTVVLAPGGSASGHGGEQTCTPVPGLGATITTVVRHDASNSFIALIAAARAETKTRVGIYFVTSQDLLRWTSPQLLFEVPLMFNYRCTDAAAYGYPALLDSESPSRNFESVGSGAWLYLTRFVVENCKLSNERDLVRYRVHIGVESP